VQTLPLVWGVGGLVRAEGGFVLEGISPTYYGKKMAQEIARRANLVIIANRICVVQLSDLAPTDPFTR
jgi:hypothetical protein